jgi:predicted ATP-grasp superfamily ATP-dependent carboligase
MQKNKILVLGTYRQSITVVRSLARAGFEVVIWREGKRKAYTEYSRYSRETWEREETNGMGNEAGFIDSLIRHLIRENTPPLVFPIGDDYLECLARHAQRLTSYCKLVMPPPQAVFASLDKSRMYHLAEELGIPFADAQAVSSGQQAVAAAKSMGFPIVIKPIDSIRLFIKGKKAIICTTQEDLSRFFRSRPGKNDVVILQKFVRGYRHDCEFAAKDGHLVAYFEIRVLRTDRIDGTGYGVEAVSVAPSMSLRRHCETLAKRLKYSGVGAAQFLIDQESGDEYLLELNPRLDANCALSYRCGHDFPRLAVECTVGPFTKDGGQSKRGGAYTVQKHLYWLFGDLQGYLKATRWKEVRRSAWFGWGLRMLGALWRANLHPTWAWNDPLPTLALYVNGIYGEVKSIAQQEVHQLTLVRGPLPSRKQNTRSWSSSGRWRNTG